MSDSDRTPNVIHVIQHRCYNPQSVQPVSLPRKENYKDGLTVVEVAKKIVPEYFSDEGIRRLGLEELKYDENKQLWHVTIGFERSWNEEDLFDCAEREYKSLVIGEGDGDLKSITNTRGGIWDNRNDVVF